MKKILHIAEAFGSGVLNYVKNLSAWQSNTYEVYIAYGIRPETPPNFKKYFNDSIRFFEVEGFTREIDAKNDIKAFFYIKELIKEIQPDLIHLHSTKAGIIGRWAIDCNIYTVWYSPHAYSFLMMNCSNVKRNIYRFIERVSNRKACLTIADIDGEYEASKLVTSNAICIPNGINLEEMDGIINSANRLEVNKNKFTICTLGKIVYQKNPRLFNKIALHFPEINFVWIGSGPLVNELTSPNIEVTGWLDRTTAIARIMKADIFLFTSLWESLSIALLEVMYIGKPCVVSRADGNKDVIHNRKNGFVCNSEGDYIEAINELRCNPQICKAYGKRARQDIVEKYNTNVMEERYRILLSEIGM